MLNGRHLVAGEWLGTDQEFQNTPVTGSPDSFAEGTTALVAQAAEAAEAAFASYSAAPGAERAAFLRRIAVEIDARGVELTAQGTKETGLPAARLDGERGRTVGQLRLFADHVEGGAHLDCRHDIALPDRAPLPRPDLRLIQRPVGPVAVFGASNFPLAFSTAGGDTAAALAAGCPVVVRGHTAHPGVSDIVAQAIHAAIEATQVHPGVFSQIQGGGFAVGQALVQHPLIRVVGFTGSLRGGRALFDLCAARPDPIPFFGELGSINPVFVLPHAARARGDAIAAGWAASLTMGAGQFCTNPGVLIMTKGPEAKAFAEQVTEALTAVAPQTMLTPEMAEAYGNGADRIGAVDGVETLVAGVGTERSGAPGLYRTDFDTWNTNPALAHEVFGPAGLIVELAAPEDMIAMASGLDGQLTATLQIDPDDAETARTLLPVLERKAGRVLANSFPTGVEVSDAMVHGGPYPASTNFGATSVGTMSIRRFLRPVCYQDIPLEIMPPTLT